MNGRVRLRFPLMALGMLALLSGLWAGLIRLGWSLPPVRPLLSMAHGPLMVSGFLGTLIGLERAVALGRRWTYIGPLLTALGALGLILGVVGVLGPLLMTLGSLGLVAVFVHIVRRRPALFTFTMGPWCGRQSPRPGEYSSAARPSRRAAHRHRRDPEAWLRARVPFLHGPVPTEPHLLRLRDVIKRRLN